MLARSSAVLSAIIRLRVSGTKDLSFSISTRYCSGSAAYNFAPTAIYIPVIAAEIVRSFFFFGGMRRVLFFSFKISSIKISFVI